MWKGRGGKRGRYMHALTAASWVCRLHTVSEEHPHLPLPGLGFLVSARVAGCVWWSDSNLSASRLALTLFSEYLSWGWGVERELTSVGEQFFVFLFLILIYSAVPGLSCGMWDRAPWLGIEPRPAALGTWNLRHWTTRKVLESSFDIERGKRWLTVVIGKGILRKYFLRDIWWNGAPSNPAFCPSLHRPSVKFCFMVWLVHIMDLCVCVFVHMCA